MLLYQFDIKQYEVIRNVIPAKAEIHFKMRDANSSRKEKWIPAFAGMT
jgi:hypothetical protein